MYTAVFYVYALFGAPILLTALRKTLAEGAVNRALALVLLPAIVLGFIGLRMKTRSIAARMHAPTSLSIRQNALIFTIWILHATVCIILAMTALTALGVQVAGPDAGTAVVAPVIIALILAEFWALTWIFCVIPRPARHPRAMDISGEFLLLVFGCVLYTAYWDYMEINVLNDYTWIVFIFEVLATALIFMIAYLPIKLPDLLDEFHLGAPAGRKARVAGMLTMGVLTAVCPPAYQTLKGGGRYTALDRALAAPAKVKKLYLSNQRLQALPAEIGALTNARILRLTDNKLTELPPAIGGMTALRELHVGNNQLQDLPAEIGKLTNLTTLVAYNNYISDIPAELALARNLETINLRWNSLTNLPPTLAALPRLKSLKLTGNRLPAESLAVLDGTPAQRALEF